MNTRKSPIQIFGVYALLLAIALLTLFPLLWLISTALKSPTENLLETPPKLLPLEPTLDNFLRVWESLPFGQYLYNSFLVAILTVALNLLFCSLAAYPLARLSFLGRNTIFIAIVSTIMIPFQIVMIPLYIITVQLGLTNSYLGMIFPSLASAFGIFLLRQAFMGVPKEIEEAARIDGSSELGLWWFIMLPAIKPALITLAIFVFIGAWSDFLWPLIVIQDESLYTLPLGVAKLAGTFSLDWRLVAAGSIISVAPVLLLFLFLQKFIVPTDTGSGIKG
ncbi:sugar ABC transporter permease [Cylindrospermopsis raciborskii CENA303]|uniref:Sugar ABC transporter permease n=1 Tax=Cylindrospermopsis raciborskii CENA303 TaxID=1170769 RepID=A0A1X4G5D5_9CYAN|nr:carbohydrate ABC transporter permease [Cylindrospermopsis raciborskii]OSO89793.1 sugar ABC transporter permease [Cylindrospermopsis raciborskii CENA303]